MKKSQTSVRGGYEDFLCPFTDMYITQGANMKPTHQGTKANDVRGKQTGVRYAYYAPCTCKCIRAIPSYGQATWQSVNKVRFANGRIDYATFVTVHDDSFNTKVGQIVKQGQQLGNMGTKGYATGVHCHIEIEQGNDTAWYKNKYGNYQLNNEYDTDDCYFVDGTNILNGMGGNWKTTDKVPVKKPSVKDTRNFVNLPPTVDSWSFYKLNSKPLKINRMGTLNPKRFGGLSYYVYAYRDNNTTAEIQTQQFGRVKIYIKNTPATITIGKYKYQNGSH